MTELRGTIMQAGDIKGIQTEDGDQLTGLVVLVPWKRLRDCPRNLAYAEVVIRFADEEKPAFGKPDGQAEDKP